MDKKSFELIHAELVVRRKELLTPHYMRVYLTGDKVPLFANTTVGINNKILIPSAQDLPPVRRTYTHRGIDLDKNEIWIDFVVHGDEGPASAWAIAAKEGDALEVLMKSGKMELYRNADYHLLVGDATAIPVLGAILEDLPAGAKGVCVLEVYGKEDEQELRTQADMEMIWLHNDNPKTGSRLPDAFRQLVLPDGSRSGYVAAEFSAVKEIRHYLRKIKGWRQEELYAYSYWKAGVAEDKSLGDRRKEKEED